MKVVLILGSNEGDRRQLIEEAVRMMSQIGTLSAKSPLYETQPWGFDAETPFYNQVIILETQLSPDAILTKCLEVEQVLGRKRNNNGYNSRTIDIDILFYESEIINTQNLVIPHPLMQERNFVLHPLHEVLPDFIHPILKKTISELLKECTDHNKVRKITL